MSKWLNLIGILYYVILEEKLMVVSKKYCSAIDRLSIIWKSDVTDKMKYSFFQAAVLSILLHGCTTWRLTKRLKKKLDGNYIRMLRAILNKSWRQDPTRHQLCGHLPSITKTIQVRRTRHAGHCWRSKDDLISDVLLWTSAYAQAKAERPARTYIQQLCEDTGCSPEDQPEAMNYWEKWRERVRDIRASCTTSWWWIFSSENTRLWKRNRTDFKKICDVLSEKWLLKTNLQRYIFSGELCTEFAKSKSFAKD